ncbi:MAG: DUF2505 domain-containing protein [Propionibacteriaceae bacterium]|jgi:hypothetical protein|nr:DUF2505 domain-containing protein [Propionibacteriaceae bacterium]
MDKTGTMGNMEFSACNSFACTVPEAFAMLTDTEFLRRVAAASNPISHSVVVDGNHTKTERTLASVPPASAFTGPEVSLIEQVAWDEPSGPQRTGLASVELAGLPLSLEGTVCLRPEEQGCVLEYTGELTVAIPVLGKKLETVAAPLLLRGIDFQQQVADAWLA